MSTFIQFPIHFDYTYTLKKQKQKTRHALYEINTSFTPKHTNTLIQTKVIFISAKTNLWLKEIKQLSNSCIFCKVSFNYMNNHVDWVENQSGITWNDSRWT